MATNIYSTNSHGNLICGSSTIGTTIYSNGSSNIAYNYDLVDRNEKLKDFIEFGLQLMGIDLSFEDFILRLLQYKQLPGLQYQCFRPDHQEWQY